MIKLLDAVTAAAPGTFMQLDTPRDKHAFEVTFEGTISTLYVSLEGSVAGFIWFTMATLNFGSSDLTAKGMITTVADKMVERVRAKVETYNGGFASRGTLTITGTLASGNTVTIDTKTYRFGSSLATAEGSILIGASAATSIQNLSLAITHGAGSGTKYTSAASHDSVTLATLAAGSMVVKARTAGTAGNSIVTSETSSSLNWGAAAMRRGLAKGTVTAYYTPQPNR